MGKTELIDLTSFDPSRARAEAVSARMRGRLAESLRYILDQATGQVTALLGDAIGAMGELARAGDPATRLRAATAIINMVDRFHYQQDFDDRLAALQARHEEADRETS